MNVRKSQGPLVYKNPFLSDVKTKSVAITSRKNLSPKAGHLVKVPPTRATRTICEERLACKRPLRVAVYICADCRTRQCDLCETLIHENPKFLFHERKRLVFPPEKLICELNCETRNLADTFCKACNKRLCFACDLITHQSRAFKEHYRVPFELEEFLSIIPEGQSGLSDTPDDYTSLQEFHSIIPEEHSIIQESESYPSLQEFHSIIPGVHSITQEPESYLLFQQFHTKKQPVLVPEIVPISNTSHSPDLDTESDYQYKSISETSSMMTMHSIPDVLSSTNVSLENNKSFFLVNDKEQLQIKTEEEFIEILNCKGDSKLKVLSIFGNTGEGKSYTLNHTFFNGANVFATSDSPDSCTVGVWAVYKKMDQCDLLILDTEGLLGLTENHNQRSRLLLKIIAVSDIIIYRTRAERLHTDLYTFLGDASKAYVKHFMIELEAAIKHFNFSSVSSVGPSVIIFHETLNTKVLTSDEQGRSPEEQLKLKFHKSGLTIDAYNSLEYIGTQTKKDGNTSFQELEKAVQKTLSTSTVRSCRTPGDIYKLLKALNDKFNGDIENTLPSSFLLQYLTCTSVCQSCNSRCMLSTNHSLVKHDSKDACKYQHQFDNKIYFCRKCTKDGRKVQVFPRTCSTGDSSWLGLVKYAWSGYVIECPTCGIIYRSREHWYGNKEPYESTVDTEFCHVWANEIYNNQPNPNVGQRMIDSVSCITDVVSSISAKPTKTITSWVADQLAPEYWKPNSEIINCGKCQKEFGILDKKHHCRACGEGFCEDCSSKSKLVPWRGWGSSPVRVCDLCYEKDKEGEEVSPMEPTVTARRVGEVLHTAIGTVASGISYPIGIIKHTARPSYWIPDEELKDCYLCKRTFTEKLPLHHCRACGQGICEDCSPALKAVPSRGWDYPVRICKKCEEKEF